MTQLMMLVVIDGDQASPSSNLYEFILQWIVFSNFKIFFILADKTVDEQWPKKYYLASTNHQQYERFNVPKI